MRIVSPLLKRVVYPSLSSMGVFQSTTARGLAVVTYHGVLPGGYQPVDTALDGNLITRETLRRQLRLLKAHYDVVSPDDVLVWLQGGELPARAVLLTCDDGLLNHLTDLLPVLQQEGVKCIFFVTAASAGAERKMLWYEDLFLLLVRAQEGQLKVSCGGIEICGALSSREQRRTFWWNLVKRLSQLDAEARYAFLSAIREQTGPSSWRGLDGADPVACRRFGLLTCAELSELAKAGMTIGAHTVSHPVLSQMSPELARVEIVNCREQLQSALRQPVWALAYPFGDPQSVTEQVVQFAGQAGFAAAFLNFGGGLGAGLPRFALPRIHVTSEMSLGELDAHVSGFQVRLQKFAGRASLNRIGG